MRSDLLLSACEPVDNQPTLKLLELKLWSSGLADVGQATRYRAALQQRYPQWRVTAHLVAQGFSDAVIRAATEENIVCWEIHEAHQGRHMKARNRAGAGA